MPSPGPIRWIYATTDCSNHNGFGAHHSIGMVGRASVRARGDVPFDCFGSLGQAAPGFDSHGAAHISAAGPYGHHNGCSGDSWSDRPPYTGPRALCGYLPGDFACALFPANVRAATHNLTIGGRRATPLLARALIQVVFLTATLAVALR